MHRRFRPPLWAWCAYPPVLALLLALGGWQAQRGLEKQAIDDAAAALTETVAVPWVPTLQPQLQPPIRVVVTGHYRPQLTLLLDNQSYQRQPGYHLWSMLERDDGATLMVNRGWLPADGDRRQLPAVTAPEGEQVLTGLWRPLPRPGWVLPSRACEAGHTPAEISVVQFPDVEQLRCLTGAAVSDGILLLDPDATQPLVREWAMGAAVPTSRHFGYAAQWFVFAMVLTFFFIRLNLRESADA